MTSAFCTSCWQVAVFSVTVPAKCPTCGGHRWRIVKPPDTPKVYKLSENDRTFLRSINVQPEV